MVELNQDRTILPPRRNGKPFQMNSLKRVYQRDLNLVFVWNSEEHAAYSKKPWEQGRGGSTYKSLR
jgi:hypothetical protein